MVAEFVDSYSRDSMRFKYVSVLPFVSVNGRYLLISILNPGQYNKVKSYIDRGQSNKPFLAGDEEENAEELWIDEAKRRYDLYKQGKTSEKPANQVLENAKTKLK